MHLFTKFFNQTKFALLVALLFSITSLNAQLRQYDDAWGDAGIKLTKESPAGVSINFSITSLQFVDNEEIDGPTMKDIQMPQVFLPNDEGMPNLPGFSRNIAIPQGAQAR